MLIIGVFLVAVLIGAYTWFGPDPGNVIRAAAADVPSFALLSKEETVAELGKIITGQSHKGYQGTVELLKDGNLKTVLKSRDSDYESKRIIPLAQLDTFLYAEQSPKGKRIWDIRVFCAHYQQCIIGSTNRSKGNFTLNADTVFYIEPDGDVWQILGILNRLLELHGAQSTIDTSRNTIRISQEYWQRLTDDF
ncbi:hypothetical protein [Leptolyngbya sp. PCC 6406]|uniref:hypothetical protein n=1 Tax=Leptolyngbya sp. PCC 6406 TaxID=1173264 RepID=UPI00031E5859|nr:hypothetical protein [Leptolyngbya sp. PCC 6406]